MTTLRTRLAQIAPSRAALWLGALAIVVVIGTAIGSAAALRGSELAIWRAELSNLSLALAEHAHQELAAATLAMDSIADTAVALPRSDPQAWRAAAGSRAVHDLMREKIAGLPQVDVATIVAADGTVVNFTRRYPPPPINLSDRDYFKERAGRAAGERAYVSAPVRNRGTGKWTFYLSRRIDDAHGHFLGLVLAGISVDALTAFHERLGLNLGAGASLTLLRNDFTVLTRWPRQEELIGLRNTTGTTFEVIAKRGRSSDVVYSEAGRLKGDSRGPAQPRLAAVRAVEQFPLLVNITATEDLFLASWRRSVSVIAAVALIATFALAVGLVVVVGALRRRERDQSQVREHALALEQIARRDSLTGLPNRLRLIELIDAALKTAKASGRRIAVAYCDLDGFKPVNDQFGHAAGDQALVAMAQRLRSTLRDADAVGRLGGDEFVILLTELDQPEECHAILERILHVIAAPLAVGGTTMRITASIGVSVAPPDEADADVMLRHADQAMYAAKADGKNRYHAFDPEQDRGSRANLHRRERLRLALARGEFVLHYQPKVDLATGALVGVEALVRWEHPENGLLPPDAFLPAVRGTPLEHELGIWTIETGIRQLGLWARAGLRLDLGLNISASQLLDPGFVEHVRGAIRAEPELRPAQVEIEILETAALSDIDRAKTVLTACRADGLRIALDDFGTGYSSLANLRSLPVDTLKIDRSFVLNMLAAPSDLEIVEGIVRLAHAFRLAVVAEGVETDAQRARLLELGCRYGQGYGLGRPMPAAELETWRLQWADDAVRRPTHAAPSDARTRLLH